MTLTPMRFKNYVWPHNPRVYSIDYERKMAVSKTPFAHFVSLRLEQEPREDYVRYSFVFWEDSGQDAGLQRVTGSAEGGAAQSAAPRWHTVKQGDTLWAIAKSCGLRMEQLLSLNPGIKNPDLIRVGEKVRVS